MFTNCPESKTATILLRGGADQFIKEAERSLNDAIMIVRRCFRAEHIIAGGGAIELELSKFLRTEAKKIKGKEQLIISAFAKSLEVIPRTIADNAGLDSILVLNRLRHIHAKGEEGRFFGVDVNSESGTCNTFDSFVWEPIIVRKNALAAATEAATTILSIDETVRNPKSEQPGAAPVRGRGAPPGMGALGRNTRLGK